MDYLTTENFLKNAIKWLVFLMLFSPLIIFSPVLFPYVFGKALFIQILIEIMAICYVWLLYSAYRRLGSPSAYLPKLNLLFWALIAFFLALVLSTIFSVDPHYSFWSKQERMDGLFNLAHFFILFFILSGTIKSGKSWLQILDVSLIASFLISLYAAGQQFGIFFNPYTGRLSGTLGNSAFLATYLLVNIYFAILLFIQRKNFNSKFWYGALIFFEFIILLLTQTRGAFLGLAAGIIIFLSGYIILSPKNSRKKYVLALLIFLILTGSAIFAARNSNFVKNQPLLNRFTDISFQKDTGRIRLMSWKIGINAFLEKPVFGWGQENYYVAFNKHMNPSFFTYSGETFDRAHNKFVDLLVMNGFLGLLAYLFIFLAAAVALWKKRKEGLFVILILISLLGAYFVQNIALFDMPISYLMFFLFLGLIYFVSKTDGAIKPPYGKIKKYISPWAIIIVWLATILIILCFWSGNIKPLIASIKSINSQKILAASNPSDETAKLAIDNFKSSVNANSFTNPETGKILPPIFVNVLNSPQITPNTKLATLKSLTEYLEQQINEMPLFYDFYLNLTDIYNMLGSSDNSYYLDKGEKTMKKLLETYSKTPQFYYKLIINRILARDLNQARDYALQSIRLNERLSQGWWFLGITYYYAGQYDLAKENIEKAVALGYERSLTTLFFLAQTYDQLKEYDKAITNYEAAAKLNPQDIQLQFSLAKDYKAFGQKDKAKDLAEKLLASSTPETSQEIKNFINSLK
jgi:O-antigen ligase/tetratricopeptide (TPR) repeat protein